jgi:hypothetical protein
MLHLTKHHVAILRLHGGSSQPRSLARFVTLSLHESANKRAGRGEELNRILSEIARGGAIDL